MTIRLAVGLLCLLLSRSLAEAADISGYVKDASTGNLSGASIRLSGTINRTTTTNSAGFYIFSGLPSGSFSVSASYPGAPCSPGSQNVTLASASKSLPTVTCLAVKNEFFDDFLYSSVSAVSDLRLNGWTVVDTTSSPPAGARYSAQNVSIEAAGNLVLTAKTRGTLSSMSLARIETTTKFLFGSYAARVWLTDKAAADWGRSRDTGDGTVQAFYTINGSPKGDARYSECDFEYLAWDAWNGSGDRRQDMYMVTWEQLSPDIKDFFSRKGSLGGSWHTLVFHAYGDRVRFFIDGVEVVPPHSSNSAPDNSMNISLAHWIWYFVRGDGVQMSPAPVSTDRSYQMRVDWVYHAKSTYLSGSQIESIVAAKRSAGVKRKDTVLQAR